MPITDIDSVDLDEWAFDIHYVTTALKLWFGELPEPLINLNQQQGFIDAVSKPCLTRPCYASLKEHRNRKCRD